MRLTGKRENFRENFSRTVFEKYFSHFLLFEDFCKGNKFPESWGWLCYFCIWNWRAFFLIVEIASFQFRLCVFPKISFRQRLSLAFIADFGLRKVVLRAETRFAIIELYRKKNRKIGFLVIPVGQKWIPSLTRISWGNFWHREKSLKLDPLQI